MEEKIINLCAAIDLDPRNALENQILARLRERMLLKRANLVLAASLAASAVMLLTALSFGGLGAKEAGGEQNEPQNIQQYYEQHLRVSIQEFEKNDILLIKDNAH